MVWHNDQVSEKESKLIIEIASSCLENEGDFIEMGCYEGDTSLLLAELLKKWQNENEIVEKYVEKPVKKLWIYDSFEGLPEKSENDESASGQSFKKGELYATKIDVKKRFLKAGLKLPIIKKAWFSELSDNDLPDKIAFAFLDGDFYDSIRDSLKLVRDKMSENGVIIVHDYRNESLPGVAKAVDEWTEGKKYRMAVRESMAVIYNSRVDS